MDKLKNLAHFKAEPVLFLQVFDLQLKNDLCTFTQQQKIESMQSVVIDELTVNIQDITSGQVSRNALNTLDSSLSGNDWAFWIDSNNYLYIG